MHIDARLPRGTASDSLMTQIHIGNVLQTHAALEQQAIAVQLALHDASDLRSIPRCGDDPISRDAQKMFQAKIDHILDTHDVYLAELREACTRLKEAAVQYGLVEDETAESFR
ncbi:hypothetical protein [Pseudonocardia sp. NPDC046786]|uniref:hypothetical protein n=1 Tax=Pseudonocardia sp. NPDC046786 TaxID=3155471 RepID=UPI0033E8D12B